MAAGKGPEPFVDFAVEVIVEAIAELTDVGAVQLQLAGATARFSLAEIAGAAGRTADVELGAGVDGRVRRQHADDPAAAPAAAVITGGTGVLRVGGAVAVGVDVLCERVTA